MKTTMVTSSSTSVTNAEIWLLGVSKGGTEPRSVASETRPYSPTPQSQHSHSRVTAHGHSTRSQHTVTAHGHSTRSHHGHSTRSQHTVTTDGSPNAPPRSCQSPSHCCHHRHRHHHACTCNRCQKTRFFIFSSRLENASILLARSSASCRPRKRRESRIEDLTFVSAAGKCVGGMSCLLSH